MIANRPVGLIPRTGFRKSIVHRKVPTPPPESRNEADIMREDDDRLRRYVPLFRRIIILVAVLTAVPVILWTITAFVRSYVGPPKIPTFHQFAATEPSEASANTDAGGQPQAAAQQDKLSDASTATVEARATATDARDVSVLKGSLPGEQSADNEANTPKTSDATPAAPSSPKAADMAAAPAAPIAAPANVGALAAQQPAPVSEPAAETEPAAAPLPGPIPLPRRRPHVVAEARMTQMAQMNVPMPRPRPDSAGPAPPPETNAGPLDFLQNLFH